MVTFLCSQNIDFIDLGVGINMIDQKDGVNQRNRKQLIRTKERFDRCRFG